MAEHRINLESAIMELEGLAPTLDLVAGEVVSDVLSLRQQGEGAAAALVGGVPVAALDYVSGKVREAVKALRVTFDAVPAGCILDDPAPQSGASVATCYGAWLEASREAEAAPTTEGTDAAAERMAALEGQIASLPAHSLPDVRHKLAVLEYLAGQAGLGELRALAGSLAGDVARLTGQGNAA